jgi:hypothetical protein
MPETWKLAADAFRRGDDVLAGCVLVLLFGSTD